MYRVLIVDDEPDILYGITSMIDWSSLSIDTPDTAASLQQARSISAQRSPDIVITDIRLDDGWGYELIPQLKQVGITPRFIMVSGYDDFNFVRQSLLLGAKDYLLKPVNKQELYAVLNTIIQEDFGTVLENQQKIALDPVTAKPVDSYSNLTKKLLDVISRNTANSISLKAIADQLGMNSKYIGRIFLQDTNMKFSDYLFAYRMKIAANPIQTTDESIQQIAECVGYSQMPYFYTHFKSYFNISPGNLRGSGGLNES